MIHSFSVFGNGLIKGGLLEYSWTYVKNCWNKLTDPEFIEVISKNDIIGLGEIHSELKVSIPGFISVKQKIRDKKSKGPKIAGGDWCVCQRRNISYG